MKNKRAKTYYYCGRDHNGQRTGHYFEVKLKPDQIEEREYGLFYRGHFLYTSFYEVLLACQS
jgi:hypothetical protein